MKFLDQVSPGRKIATYYILNTFIYKNNINNDEQNTVRSTITMKIRTQYNNKIQEAQMERFHSTEWLNAVISRPSRCNMLSRRTVCSSSRRMSIGFSDAVVFFYVTVLLHRFSLFTDCRVLYHLDFICCLLSLNCRWSCRCWDVPSSLSS